jgi:nitrate reductase gamma subunit
MNWFSFLSAGILVYIAVAVFIGGTISQIIRWRARAKSNIRQGMFPKPRGPGRFLKLGWDSLLFPWVLDTDRWMWFFVITMHLAGLGLFFGHTRLFGDVPFMISIFGEAGMERLGGLLGAAIGIYLFIAFSYFLIRRMKYPYKELSVPADYLLLLLILLLVLLGDHLRLTKPFELADYRAYSSSLLALKPAFPESIAESPAKWVLTFHVLTANMLLIYFPFSKLIHAAGTYAGNLLRSE